MTKEYAPKTTIFIHPEIVAIAGPLLVRVLMRDRRPLPPAIEKIAEKEDRVRVQNFLYARERPSEVLVDVKNGKVVQRPRAAGVRMRVYELRIGDEDESVGV